MESVESVLDGVRSGTDSKTTVPLDTDHIFGPRITTETVRVCHTGTCPVTAGNPEPRKQPGYSPNLETLALDTVPTVSIIPFRPTRDPPEWEGRSESRRRRGLKSGLGKE